MLIVNTDHGFLLGEHDWWGKMRMPFYNEIANTPLFIWDPRSKIQGERRKSLVQTIDLPATILEYFGLPLPKDMQGRPLRETMATDKPVREAGLFGLHGAHVNCTDGRYVYMRGPASPDNSRLYNYTLMPTHMRRTFSVEEIHRLDGLQAPFSFTKGCQTMKIKSGKAWVEESELKTFLFDTRTDPGQRKALHDPAVERAMTRLLVQCMKDNDAPPEQFIRLGLEPARQ